MARKTGEARQAEIIAVTRDLIFNEGFSNFTVRTVASRIGISEAAIYRHFKSKEDLLLGLLDSLFVPWREALEGLLQENVAARLKLRRLVEIHLHHLVIRQLNPILFFSEAIRPENCHLFEKLSSSLGFLQNTVTAIVRQGVEAREFKPETEIASSTACIVGLIQTTVIKWTLQRKTDGLVEHASSLMDFFVELIELKGSRK
ncbi:MAG TPA: TetR/AcrR family transcriptional regulator [Candidatus Rifleibacterium sp.]|jgi:AcrR family transcriptional regulator|nr:TetR/AcrR family transcriptional regulator [Candidatus Rifleibacterium sp.]HPW58794.1 TetR/AcrR family transcriptional regulator [Candidatus Rifleibacterium sp.]